MVNEEAIARLGRIERLQMSVNAVLNGARESQNPYSLIDTAVFLQGEMAREFQALEGNLKGMGCECGYATDIKQTE